MKLFFDFDDFFLDTENSLVSETFARYATLTGVSLEVVRETYRYFSRAKAENGKCYTYEEHLRLLQRHADFNSNSVCKEMEIFFRDLRRFIYSGAEDFLKKFNKEDLFLLTYGDDDFQMTKIFGSGLQNYFSRIFVTQGNKVEEIKRLRQVLNIPQNDRIIFGDNRCEYFAGAKEAGLISIHLKRPEDRASSNPCGDCQFVVNDFDQLYECIKRLN